MGHGWYMSVKRTNVYADPEDLAIFKEAAEYDTDAILTLGRHDFRALRPLGRHKAFRVLPDDLPL